MTAAIIFVGRALFVLDGALSCIHGCFFYSWAGLLSAPFCVKGGVVYG